MGTHKGNNACLNRLVANQNSVLLDNAASNGVTFAALTTGAVGAHTVATVTGVIAVQIFAVCGTNVGIQAGATIEVGTALSTAALIAQTAGDAIDANEIWHDASPDASVELEAVITAKIVTQNLIYTVATDTLDSGAVTFYIRWTPISPDGALTVATIT